MYDIILADPPWRYDSYKKPGSGHGKARDYYEDMSLEEICRFEVDGAQIRYITRDNAALFLWVTWPMIFDAKKVIDAWGFEYKAPAWVWVKQNKDHSLKMGMGHYTRSNTEPCLLAIKGSMPVSDRSIISVIMCQWERHSQKPRQQYGLIERLYPGKQCIELFARTGDSGWKTNGNDEARHIRQYTMPWASHNA